MYRYEYCFRVKQDYLFFIIRNYLISGILQLYKLMVYWYCPGHF